MPLREALGHEAVDPLALRLVGGPVRSGVEDGAHPLPALLLDVWQERELRPVVAEQDLEGLLREPLRQLPEDSLQGADHVAGLALPDDPPELEAVLREGDREERAPVGRLPDHGARLDEALAGPGLPPLEEVLVGPADQDADVRDARPLSLGGQVAEADVAPELVGLGGEEPGVDEAPHRPLGADRAEGGVGGVDVVDGLPEPDPLGHDGVGLPERLGREPRPRAGGPADVAQLLRHLAAVEGPLQAAVGLLPAAVARAEPLAGAGEPDARHDGGPPRDLAEDGRLVDPEPRGDLPEGAVVQDACLDDDAVGEVEAAGLAAPRPFCLLAHSRLLSEAWEGGPSMAQARRDFRRGRGVAFPVSPNE